MPPVWTKSQISFLSRSSTQSFPLGFRKLAKAESGTERETGARSAACLCCCHCHWRDYLRQHLIVVLTETSRMF
jgi:hypothetical protein